MRKKAIYIKLIKICAKKQARFFSVVKINNKMRNHILNNDY